MRICFFGTPDAALPALEAFLADPDTEVRAVVTNPDRPSGRGYRLTPPPVKRLAEQAGVPVWQPQRARECLEQLQAADVDACAVVAYGALLPRDVLAVGGAGFVNLHFSLLPRWRGAAPVQHALLDGDEVTGVTCFVLDQGMDTGPVLARLATPIRSDDTGGALVARLAQLGASLLVESVRGLVDGALVPVPQPDSGATYAPKIGPDDSALDWSRSAAALARAVRAFNPVPGAHTSLDGQRLKIHRAIVAGEGSPGTVRPGVVRPGVVRPGVVIEVTELGPVVACGDGALVLEEVQPAGKPRMSGGAFANGYRLLGATLGDASGDDASAGDG